MHKTVVLNCVGLTPSLLGAHTPRLNALAHAGTLTQIRPPVPAVTCSVQASFLTGCWPDEHGIVGNGWYFRDECEVRFWHQSDKLVQRPRIWDIARKRDPRFTCCNLFWWNAMYSGADVTVTPRPMYPADGRKLPDVWTRPADLRQQLQRQLGRFPLFRFWGPATSIESTRWIASAAIEVDRRYDCTLTLVYLPHLDYALQRLGPDSPLIGSHLAELDAEVGRLLDHFQSRGARCLVVSEYGITAVRRPVHLNRALRDAGLLQTRDELGRELLDAGASAAFAVADHQVAHVYVNDASKLAAAREVVESVKGVARVYAGLERGHVRLDHSRAGDLVVLAEPDAWFTYYYWTSDRQAPDFARTVDIHRKPGYDPAELFIDPALAVPQLRIAWTLLKKKLGFRTLLQVIPLDAGLVRGSHGLPPRSPDESPLLISSQREAPPARTIDAPQVLDRILHSVFA